MKMISFIAILFFVFILIVGTVSAYNITNVGSEFITFDIENFTDNVTGGGGGYIGYPPYLYNDATYMYFNDSKMNETIDLRASGLGDNASFNQSMIEVIIDNESIIRWWNLSWLFNNQILDGNASSICADNTYLDGNGLCINFNNTVTDLSDDIYVNEAGDTMSGDLDMDGNYLKLKGWEGYMYYDDGGDILHFISSSEASIGYIEFDTDGDFSPEIQFFKQNGDAKINSPGADLVFIASTGIANFSDTKILSNKNITSDDQICDKNGCIGDTGLGDNASWNYSGALNYFVTYQNAMFNVFLGLFNLSANSINASLYCNATNCYTIADFLLDTDTDTDTDTHVKGDNVYLYNDSDTMYLNLTKMNMTFVRLDNSSYITFNNFSNWVNESGLIKDWNSSGLIQDLWVDITGDTMTGNLIVNAIITGNSVRSNNNLSLNYDGPDLDSYLFFYNGGSSKGVYIMYDDAAGADIGSTGEERFEISQGLGVATTLNTGGQISGATDIVAGDNIAINYLGPDADSAYYFYDGGSPTDEYLMWDDTDGADMGRTGEEQFEISNSLGVTGDISTSGYITTDTFIFAISPSGYVRANNVYSDTDVYVNYNAPQYDSYLYFYDGSSSQGEYLMWDDSSLGDIGVVGEEQFELSNNLAITGDVRATTYYGTNANVTTLNATRLLIGEQSKTNSFNAIGVEIKPTLSSNNEHLYGVYSSPKTSLTNNNSKVFYGLGGYALVGKTSTKEIHGLRFGTYTILSGFTNRTRQLYGASFFGSSAYAGTVKPKDIFGLYVTPVNSFDSYFSTFDSNNAYGVYINEETNGFGTTKTYTNQTMLWIKKPTAGTNKYQVFLEGTSVGSGIYFNRANTYIRSPTTRIININASQVGIRQETPLYPLTVFGSSYATKISIYAEHNVSATGFIDRTSVFDNESYEWDYIKDRSAYTNGTHINHTAFYGFTSWEVPDIERAVVIQEVQQRCFINYSCSNITQMITKEEFELYCIPSDVCVDELVNVTTYPYNKTEEGVNMGDEINVLRQALYDQHDGIDVIQDVDGTGVPLVKVAHEISAEDVIFRTTVYDKTEGTALDKLKDASDMLDDKGDIIHSELIGARTITINGKPEAGASVGDKVATLEQAVYELREIVYAQNITINNNKAKIKVLETELCKKDNTYLWCRTIGQI